MANKVKMSVEMRIIKLSLIVQEPTEVFVRWQRGSQKYDTEKKELTADKPVHEYVRKDAVAMMNMSLIRNPDGTWQPDDNKLELYCAGEVVGTCYFDMAKYEGKTPVVETAMIVPADSTDAGTVLKGHADRYPGAFIEFRVTVKQDQAAANRRKSGYSSAAQFEALTQMNRKSSIMFQPPATPTSDVGSQQMVNYEAIIAKLTAENASLRN